MKTATSARTYKIRLVIGPSTGTAREDGAQSNGKIASKTNRPHLGYPVTLEKVRDWSRGDITAAFGIQADDDLYNSSTYKLEYFDPATGRWKLFHHVVH